MFEGAELMAPVVMGVVRDGEGWPFVERLGQVDVDADGEQLIVTAKERLVLRCGEASITLTRVGKVLIEGEYIVSRARRASRSAKSPDSEALSSACLLFRFGNAYSTWSLGAGFCAHTDTRLSLSSPVSLRQR